MKKSHHDYSDEPPHEETAEEMILRLEKECHCRVDSNSFDNPVVAGLLGAAARALGQSHHRSEDDVVAGTLIKFNLSAEGRRKREADRMIADLLAAGVSPDDLRDLMDNNHHPDSGQAQGGRHP